MKRQRNKENKHLKTGLFHAHLLRYVLGASAPRIPCSAQYSYREGRDYFVILRPGCFVASLGFHYTPTNIPDPHYLPSSFSSKSSLSKFSWQFPGLPVRLLKIYFIGGPTRNGVSYGRAVSLSALMPHCGSPCTRVLKRSAAVQSYQSDQDDQPPSPIQTSAAILAEQRFFFSSGYQPVSSWQLCRMASGISLTSARQRHPHLKTLQTRESVYTIMRRPCIHLATLLLRSWDDCQNGTPKPLIINLTFPEF